VIRFSGGRAGRASDSEGNDRWELLWTCAATVLFLGLTLLSYSAWAEVRFEGARAGGGDPDRLTVEVTAQQFVWNMRYAGADGEFGPLDSRLIDDSIGNPVGVDRQDPAGADDIIAARLAVVVNREVEVILKSKDVVHNFFVPELRIKLDTVPGLTGRLRFTPEKTGRYEIACSELCGLGHYRMRAYLDVMEADQFQAWFDEQQSYLP
jgi:cytochrome c oxidase subunit 2